MPQDLDDLQKIIDVQFDKLERAATGGQVNQLVHGLRIHLRHKAQLGGRLTERERQIAVHREGTARRRSRLPQLVGFLVFLAALLAAAWYLWKHVL